MSDLRYEIWGGDLNSLSFWDGGSPEYLEACDTLPEAVECCEAWQTRQYAAHVLDTMTGRTFTPTDVRGEKGARHAMREMVAAQGHFPWSLRCDPEVSP